MIVTVSNSSAVVISADTGSTWRVANILPAGTGEVVDVEFGNDNSLLYASVQLPTGQGALYDSNDGGESWDLVSITKDATKVATLRDLHVDADDPRRMWAHDGESLWRSIDGGSSWRTSRPSGGGLNTFVVREHQEQGVVYAFMSTQGQVFRSDSDGASWTEVASTPGIVNGATDSTFGIAVSLAIGNAEAYVLSGDWIPLVTEDYPGFAELTGDRDLPSRLFAHTTAHIFSYGGGLPSRPPTDFLPPAATSGNTFDPQCEEPAPIDSGRNVQSGTHLSPDGVQLSMMPGETRRVDYELFLRRALPLDVFFLVDTSISMGGAICMHLSGLRDIVDAFESRNADVRFGLAEYNDVNYRTARCSTAYNLKWALSPPDQGLVGAFKELRICGGSEPATFALEQAVAGSGNDFRPLGRSRMDVEPGLQAGFRDYATKVIVNVTDEAFYRDVQIPTRDQTIRMLRAHDVFQMGVLPRPATSTVEGIGDPAGVEESRPDLEAVASGTGAVAQSPLDCNGDGNPEIQPGDPLVCALATAGEHAVYAEVLTEMVESVVRPRPVRLVPMSGRAVVKSVTPSVYPEVKFDDRDRTLRFSVTYHCGLGESGRLFPVRLAAPDSIDPHAEVTTTVACGIRPPEAISPLAALGLGPGARLPLPAGPQINPHPQQQVQHQAQQQAQQQAQGQAQAAAVAQRQEQPQMAFVNAARQLKQQLADGHAMSRLVSERRAPGDDARHLVALAGASFFLLVGHSLVLARSVVLRTRRSK